MTKHFCDICEKEVSLEDEVKIRRFQKGEVTLCEMCFSDDEIFGNIRSKFIDKKLQTVDLVVAT